MTSDSVFFLSNADRAKVSECEQTTIVKVTSRSRIYVQKCLRGCPRLVINGIATTVRTRPIALCRFFPTSYNAPMSRYTQSHISDELESVWRLHNTPQSSKCRWSWPSRRLRAEIWGQGPEALGYDSPRRAGGLESPSPPPRDDLRQPRLAMHCRGWRECQWQM
jgi:hypothetical protein